MLKSYQVYEVDAAGMTLELSPTAAEHLHLKEDQLIILRFGSLSIQTKISVHQLSQRPVNSMGLSKAAFEALKIHKNLSLQIKSINDNQLQIGPVVGILTFPHVIWNKQLNRYINYTKYIKGRGVLYVFRPSDICPDKQTITGFYYDEEKTSWVQEAFPYPDVVIDRMYPNDYKTHSELEKVIGENKIFNKKTLITKIEFYEVLEKNSFLQKYIPETKLFSGASDLTDYLTRHGSVFLKPTDSMRGRGIIFITSDEKELVCRYIDGGEPKRLKIPRADYLFEVLGRVSDYKRTYIIQEAVNRMEFMQRPFSFRVMTTKEGSGQWTAPIIITKVAPPGAFLTNVSSGAEYLSLREILEWIKDQLSDENIKLLEQLTELSLKCSIALDSKLGPLGKLGIDIVVDKSGKPWLIEANGNPGIIYRRGQSEFPAWRNKSFEHPINYALYLAGFSDHDESQT